jgi:hypothetical protein
VLAAAVLLTGGLRAADDPPKTDQRPRDGARGDEGRADQDVQKQVEQLRRELAEMRRRMDQMFPNFPPALPGAGDGRRFFGGELPGRFGGQPRLGVRVDRPSDALADQLDLKKGQGLVILDVVPDTPAAQAGLKPHDVLVELNGKPVANDRDAFAGMVEGIKSDTPVDAKVIRKGKEETVKGIKLREGPPERRGGPGDTGRERPRR